jgi:Flp pilus assembly secretin CpaC
VVLVEVQPGLTHTFLSGLRKTTDGLVSADGRRSQVFSSVLEPPHERRAFLGFLSALKQGGLAKVVAEPRLVTLSGRPASFLAGGEQAVPVPAGLGQIGVQFEEFGTRLNFIPIVLGNGKVRLEVEPEISRLDPASSVKLHGKEVPGRITDRVNTTIELEDGQAFVIGGLVQREQAATCQMVPVLGELPLVGHLFRSQAIHTVEKELVVLITPTILSPDGAPKQTKKASGDGTTPKASASLRRLERQMKHLQQEVDALHRELRSAHATGSTTAGER